ncbi:MAG: DUF2299 family protein [Nitrososphaeraceae archaeon]
MVDLHSKQEAVDVVKKWLLEEEYNITSVPNENADYNFRITKMNMIMNVVFHKRSEDSLIIAGNLTFGSEEQAMLRYTITKRELLFDIEMLCTQLNLEFSMNPVEDKGEYSLEDIGLSKTLYFDGLTKQSFFDSLNAMFNSLSLIISKFLMLRLTGSTK